MAGKTHTRIAMFLMLSFLLIIVVGFYLFPQYWGPDSLLQSGLISMVLIGLGVSIFTCNYYRVRALLATSGPKRAKRARWGSIVFHLGMVVVLVGFGVSFLFGMRGQVIIPEGVAVRFPKDINITKTGKLHLFKEYSVGLQKVKMIKNRAVTGQVRSEMDFFADSLPNRRIMEINKPVKFMGYYWRSMNWGYSVYLTLENKGEVVVDDYLNIATHGDGAYYDQYSLPDMGKFQLQFYADTGKDGKPLRNAFLPGKPVVGIKFLEGNDGASPVEVIIPLGQKKDVNGFKVSFREYRYWEAFDVSSDPGEVFIYLGGTLCIAGLFTRVFFRSN